MSFSWVARIIGVSHLHTWQFHSSSWSINTPLCIYTTYSLSIHQLLDT
jgi:hypothetical protein